LILRDGFPGPGDQSIQIVTGAHRFDHYAAAFRAYLDGLFQRDLGRWRLCFVWQGGDAYDVEIVDYH